METKIESIISQNLIDLRKNLNLKQSDLSEAIGYSDKTISRWENGTSVPDIGTLVKLAEFYNITVMDLINENAVEKFNLEGKVREKETLINDISLTALSALTIWLIAIIIYIGLAIIQQIYFWQTFICAIPISTLFFYRSVSKSFTIKWLNFTLMSVVICGTVSSFYLIFLQYNLWPLFFLILPLEGMAVIYTFFKKKGLQKSKRRRS